MRIWGFPFRRENERCANGNCILAEASCSWYGVCKRQVLSTTLFCGIDFWIFFRTCMRFKNVTRLRLITPEIATLKLEELGNMLTSLDPGNSTAEEVQIAYRRWIKKLKRGGFADEASAITESDMEETFKRLLRLNKTPEEVFDDPRNRTVDLVLTTHSTQFVRLSLLQKFGRIRNCLTQLYAKDITSDDKQELHEALR